MIIEHFISGQRRFHKEKTPTEKAKKTSKKTSKKIVDSLDYYVNDTFGNAFNNFILSIKKNVFDHKFLSLIIFVLVLIIVIKSLK
tara:strand:+ start:240 stop:494 length:255 start_codon:yes stop_codon:yes gene_type:complete